MLSLSERLQLTGGSIMNESSMVLGDISLVSLHLMHIRCSTNCIKCGACLGNIASSRLALLHAQVFRKAVAHGESTMNESSIFTTILGDNCSTSKKG